MLSFSACDHHWHLISICPMQAIWPPEGPVYLWRGVGCIRKCDPEVGEGTASGNVLGGGPLRSFYSNRPQL